MSSKAPTLLQRIIKPGIPSGILILFVLAAVLFSKSFLSEYVMFSNDAPLGSMTAEFNQPPATFYGMWNPLNWVGYYSGQLAPNLTYGFLWAAGSVGYLKFHAVLCLLFLGLSALLFLRRLKLAPTACQLGAIAAMLNSDFLSTASWGVASQCLCFGLSYLALACVVDKNAPRRWLGVILAGSAVGLSLMEGYDIGAIFSLCVAAFLLYQALMEKKTRLLVRLTRGVCTTAIVAVVAAIVSFHTVSSLVGTQIQGVSGMKGEERNSQEQWDWATQWSLPKKEALSIVVPGLFGYRMDTQGGGNYWGQVGRTPGWEEHHQGTPRFIGGGFYCGILVGVIALWALAQSFRKQDSVYSETDRKWIWFWGGVCVVSLLLAFGRHAPFYQLVYGLPFFSTIRNPVKFAHVLNWALVVLFAYGVNGLVMRYAAKTGAGPSSRSWWQRLSSWDRRWVGASGMVFFGSCVFWLVYASSKKDLEAYLVKEAIDPGLAPLVASFSIHSVGIFVLLFGIALALVALGVAGFFSGRRSAWAGVVLGLFLIFDLGRASQPWIVHVNYQQKYASNPVIDFLRQKPYEHRVAGLPFPLPNELSLLDQLYRIEWHQHHFRFYNIQSLDIVQMPRIPEEVAAFESAFRPDPSQPETIFRILRRWELTNTRYLLGPAEFVDALNTQLDDGRGRFRIQQAFEIVPKPGVASATKLEDLTAVPTPEGRYAVIEFTGALPRASLYTNWQVVTNDAATLELLASPSFNPAETVLVANPIAPPSLADQTNTIAGAVEIVSYAPKHVVLEASNAAPSVLLLNDKFDPGWKLTLDGQPGEILRCNSVMRGVLLEPGQHMVEFSFEPPVRGLYVTLTAMSMSILLLGFLIISTVRARKSPDSDQDSRPTKAPSGDREKSRKA